MNKDIVPELLERIQNEFKNKTSKSEILKKKILALKDKKVTHKDSNDFAIELGEILAKVFQDEITENLLPDNKMYYNIAKRLIEPNLIKNYDLVSDYSKNVQEILNKESKISIKAIKPELNQDRIDGIVNKITKYDNFEEAKWVLDEPVKNFTQAVVDDTIKTNVEFQYKSGLTPKIVRKEAGNCCDWCKEVVGIYEYPKVPKDVFRRHQRCRCTVDYVPGEGRKQDIWSKQWTDVDKNDKIKERIEFSEKNKSVAENKKILRNDVGFNLVDNSVDNIDEFLLEKNVKQLQRMENKFGAIHKSSGSISSEDSGDAIAYVSRSLTDPLKQNLVLNKNYFSQKNRLIKETEEAINDNWSMPAKIENYFVYTVTHEYGHILQNSIMAEELTGLGGFQNFKTKATTIKGKIKAFKKLQENIQKRHFEEIIEIAAENSIEPNHVITNNLSQYGKTNYAEFFAEVFANSQLGEPNELGNAMNEWLRKKGF